MLDNIFKIENRAGPTIQSGDNRIMPISQAIRLQIPGLPGGVVWNRPVSIVVTTPGGQEQILPIRDITRIAQLSFIGIAILGVLLYWRASHK